MDLSKFKLKLFEDDDEIPKSLRTKILLCIKYQLCGTAPKMLQEPPATRATTNMIPK